MRSPFTTTPGLALLLLGCSNGNLAENEEVGPPGVQSLSRLNRAEHQNTLDDLLGVASEAASQLPVDPTAEGYDTVAVGQVLTPAHAGLYERVTDDALDRFFGAEGPRSPDFDTVVSCDVAANDEGACLQSVVRGFLLRAWRRPATDDDVAWALRLHDAALELDATPLEALRMVMKGILLAPEFIFQPEPRPGPGEVESLDGFHVATRLAHFLWSSTPDDALLDAAASGALLAEGGVAAEAIRMLADPRADALLDHFAGQWFDIRNVSTLRPNPDVHPFFDDGLKRSIQAEMRSFAEPFLRGGEPFDVVLTQQESYMERRLALHYTLLPEAGTNGYQAVAPGRLGLLTSAGWLAVTSHPDEASAVRRGHWILQKLLCDPPPPPPPDIESTVTVTPDGSVREQEEAVRQTGDCAACHRLMDPLGYTLHGYGPVGLERTIDRFGYPIDNAVELLGTPAQGPDELVDWLLTDTRLDRCIVDQTFTYAVGRAPEAGDIEVVDRATAAFQEAGRTFPALVEALVTSRSFLDVTGPAAQEIP